MPPIGERMASVETGLHVVIDDLSEVKTDVKKLVNWMIEERGARRQREISRRQLIAIIGGLSTLGGGIASLIVKVL